MIVGGGPAVDTASPKLKKNAKRPSTSSTNGGPKRNSGRKPQKKNTQVEIYSASLVGDSRNSKRKLKKTNSQRRKLDEPVGGGRSTPAKKKSSASLHKGRSEDEEGASALKQELIAKQRSSIKQAFPSFSRKNHDNDSLIRKTPEQRPPMPQESTELSKWVRATHTGMLSPGRTEVELEHNSFSLKHSGEGAALLTEGTEIL